MWILLALLSASLLGIYDVFKKRAVTGNNVLAVLFLNTLFCALLLLPVVISGIWNGDALPEGSWPAVHARIFLKSMIVLSAWLFGYFAVKHLPLTLTGPITAARPVLVLVGALLIYRETPNLYQWIGISLGFLSLLLINRIGRKEGVSTANRKWIWFAFGSTLMGAISGLYDKSLMLDGNLTPLFVQSWYALYQCLIMGVTIALIRRGKGDPVKFAWRWSIPGIAVFLTLADVAYFYALAESESMISVVSMIRRGSVIVPFCYGIFVLHEKNVKWKALDLLLLLAGLIFLILGSK